MVSGKLISLNIRGISNYRKRRTIFTWCRKQKADIIFLQETHSTERNEAQWKREWGAPLFCSHGASNARGVAILLRNNCDCKVQQTIADANGRFLMLKVLLNGEQTLLVNVYGPNRDNELAAFYLLLLQTIVKNDFDTIENIIMGGDFNCPLNPLVDKRGGNLFPRQQVINTIEELQSELDLHDVWRIKNPETRSYTWSQAEPPIFSRLDYWLISNSLMDKVYTADIIPSIKTDHSAITIEFREIDDEAKGPGIWKLNCSLLYDETYVERINFLIPRWVKEGKKDLEDPRSVWDWVKYNIKKYSRKYSMNKCKGKKVEEEMLNMELKKAYRKFQNNPSPENQAALNALQERIEKNYEKKVEGIIVRSRARWHEHGEKNSKYFFNLEKRNHIKKHIRKLSMSGVITTDPFRILEAEKNFYEKLYKSKRYEGQQNATHFRYEDLPIPTLPPDLSRSVEGVISLEECTEALKSFPLNKVPGNDGLPIEFYNTFWASVGKILLECFNAAFEKGEMSSSQRQAVITLIEKKDQDRCDLKNWRPISLLNVDAKIASKVIAERMKRLLPGLIHHNQSGYISGRSIGENIRSILDIMSYTRDKNLPGLLLFIDFEKAFDSLEWVFLNKCLELFGFGPDFIKWINTFYKNIKSCVINNGLCSQYFGVERGVRQGDPLSPYLFVIAVEILAIAVRNQENIHGIKICNSETKLLQFADDTTAILSDLDSARELFKLLNEFEKVSGLKLNVLKTEAMWIGSLQSCVDEPLGIQWKKCIKFLGIFITYDVKLLVEKNFKQRLKKISNLINLWKSRNLSIYGKVNIIKAILLPKMIYPSSVLSTPQSVIKEFNSLVFKFLWNGPDKVTRLSTYAPYETGGLKMIDFETMIRALRLSWLKRILDVDCSGFWKDYLNYALSNQGGSLFFLQCNYDTKQINISSTFYKELLLWWSDLREFVDPDRGHKYILWNNKEIMIEGKTVFYRHYFDNGIVIIKDLLYDKTNIESFAVMNEQGLKNSNFLVWTGLRHSVPSHLRVNVPNLKVVLDLENYICRNYYQHLIKRKYEKPKQWNKLCQEFDLTEDQLSRVYLLPFRVACEPYIRSFQYKVLNYILYTKDRLFKIGYIQDPYCTFCKVNQETSNHILFECPVSKFFWNTVTDNILYRLGSCCCLSLTNVIIGFLQEEMDLLNYIVILGKTYLWTCRRKEIKPNFEHFKKLLEIKYETEKYIALKNNEKNLFYKKWKLFEENILNEQTT